MNNRSGIPARLINVLWVDLESAGFGRQDILAVIGSLVHVWGDDMARWQEIEEAAREVLASGQARYRDGKAATEDVEWPRPFGQDSPHVGDLVPATTMQVLRSAVEAAPGRLTGGVDDALPPRRECPDCKSPTGIRGMCDRHFDALVDLLRRA